MRKLLARFDLSYLYALLGEATLALTLGFYIILARELGPEDYGVFAAAVALAAILSLVIQFGLPPFINREVAAHPEEGQRLTARVLLIELLSSGGVLLILPLIISLLGYQNQGALVYYLAVLSEIGRVLIMTMRSVMKGMGWFRTETVAVTLERATTVFIAYGILLQTKNLILVMATVAIVRGMVALGLFLYLSQKLNIWSKVSWRSLINITRKSYPFALSGVLWIIYYQVDVVMLNVLSSEAETGFYSASYRILEIFSALPRVIFYVIFTRFARYYISAPERLPEQIYKGTRLLFGLVMPTILIAGFLQEPLIKILYGEEFSRSILSLSILLPSITVKMVGGISNEFCQATGQEKKLPGILLVAAIANVAINGALIPRFGSGGAALATFISECILTTLSLWILGKIGYPKVSTRLRWLALLGLGVTVIPCLLVLTEFPLSLGIGIVLGGCIAILALLQPRYFPGLEP
ncbi:MAG: flippase [Oscillatoriales cyanobacterium RM1_1_9]|nr:flippase [Oscillatoriales cyanobacterium SM2_3_0]NJO47442.1 flippase [Oscillatoriales cyanobacterium RM2_1_1]NJO71209.1 flippase [Oscillatoriales cyanobacterium RM1_1_9]